MDRVLGTIWKWVDGVVRFVLLKGAKLFHVTLTEVTLSGFIQFLKFGLVGVSNTMISYVVYVVAVFFGCYYMVGTVFGFIVSVLNSFYWNNKYVFREEAGTQRSVWKALMKTFIAYGATGLLLSLALMYIWIDILHISEYIAPIISLLITIPLNYVLNKVWAFKSKKIMD